VCGFQKRRSNTISAMVKKRTNSHTPTTASEWIGDFVSCGFIRCCKLLEHWRCPGRKFVRIAFEDAETEENGD
jgi:hypothetical protein